MLREHDLGRDQDGDASPAGGEGTRTPSAS
jgi:hypothetical protein